MKYLLDSDTLIRAKNDSYRFENHPGFWDWLEQANILGLVGSVEPIRKELTGEDQLSNWVKSQGQRFFVSIDGEARKRIGEIANWAERSRQFSAAAKQEFFASPDLSLIAYVAAHGGKVVTFEKDSPDAKRKIQIPVVCRQFGLQCINLYQLIGELKPKFVLEKPS